MQNLPFETELFKDLIGQINSADFESHELAAIWLYMKSWGDLGHHVTAVQSTWNFGKGSLRKAIMDIGYTGRTIYLLDPVANSFLDSEEDNKIINLLKPLICQNLDGRILTEWLKEIYDEVRIFHQSGRSKLTGQNLSDLLTAALYFVNGMGVVRKIVKLESFSTTCMYSL